MNVKLKIFILILIGLIIGYVNKDKKYNIDNAYTIDIFSETKLPKKNILKVDKNIILSTIENISKYNRVCGSKGEIGACNYLKNKLHSYDYSVEIQEFTAYKQTYPKNINTEINSYLILEDDKSEPGYNTKNIIAKNKSFCENKKVIYITAHYDSEEKTVGAIDNLDKSEISNVIGCINIDMVGLRDSKGVVMWSYDLKNPNNIEDLTVNNNAFHV